MAADECWSRIRIYYNGKCTQVGEFSADITSTDQSLYLKMLQVDNPSRPENCDVGLYMKKCLFAWHYRWLPEAELQLKYKVSERHDRDRDKLLCLYRLFQTVPLLQVMNLDYV
ncbi:hypothetical protein [Duncaniella dubosii]|uniref:hypothetical protein n=1 Tax=Duncaniella dubosii TaxID=2518971 RepID=UPI003F6670DF